MIATSLACLVAQWIHMVEAENELPHCLSSWDCLMSSCSLPFVSVFLHMCTNNCIFTWLSKFCTLQLYQIRRPLGLAFAISFVGWETHFYFRWTLPRSSLTQSPGLWVFPAKHTPPPTFIGVGPHLNLNHGGVSLTKLTCSKDLGSGTFPFFQTQLPPLRSHPFILTAYKFK